MNTLVCKNCGSSSFTKIKDDYQCTHCGTVVVGKISYPKKRVKFIILLLTGLLIVAFLVYKSIVRVEKKIDLLDLSEQKTEQVITTKVTTKVTKKLEHYPLEGILKQYNQAGTEKAFFISLNKNGKYAYGYAIDRGSIKEASKSAFTICEEERKKRHFKEICIPYLINHHISPVVAE
jgi:rubredoxin